MPGPRVRNRARSTGEIEPSQHSETVSYSGRDLRRLVLQSIPLRGYLEGVPGYWPFE